MRNIIYKWEQPKEVSIWKSNWFLKDWHIKFLRTIAVVIIVEYLFYIFFKKIPFEKFGVHLWKYFLNALIFAILMSLYTYLIAPLIIRFTKTRYVILENGIRVTNGTYMRMHLWKKIVACSDVEKNPLFKSVLTIKFYNANAPKYYSLHFEESQRALAEEVNIFIKNKVPKEPLVPFDSFQIPDRIKLTTSQNFFIFCLCAIGAIIFGTYLFPRLSWWKSELVPLMLFLAVTFCGPGTVGMIILFGRQIFKNKQLFSFAMMYNFLALIMIVSVGIVLYINRIAEIFMKFNPPD